MALRNSYRGLARSGALTGGDPASASYWRAGRKEIADCFIGILGQRAVPRTDAPGWHRYVSGVDFMSTSETSVPTSPERPIVLERTEQRP